MAGFAVSVAGLAPPNKAEAPAAVAVEPGMAVEVGVEAVAGFTPPKTAPAVVVTAGAAAVVAAGLAPNKPPAVDAVAAAGAAAVVVAVPPPPKRFPELGGAVAVVGVVAADVDAAAGLAPNIERAPVDAPMAGAAAACVVAVPPAAFPNRPDEGAPAAGFAAPKIPPVLGAVF